jgi:hypothetical protein
MIVYLSPVMRKQWLTAQTNAVAKIAAVVTADLMKTAAST